MRVVSNVMSISPKTNIDCFRVVEKSLDFNESLAWNQVRLTESQQVGVGHVLDRHAITIGRSELQTRLAARELHRGEVLFAGVAARGTNNLAQRASKIGRRD